MNVELRVRSTVAAGVPDLNRLTRRAEALLEALGTESTLAILLTDDAESRFLCGRFRSGDAPTGVLAIPPRDETTPAEPQRPRLGDVVISLDTARRDAAEGARGRLLGVTPWRFDDEVLALLISGVLELVDQAVEPDLERLFRRLLTVS